MNDCDMELDCDVYHKDVTVEFAGLDSNCTVRTSLLLIFVLFCFYINLLFHIPPAVYNIRVINSCMERDLRTATV